MLDVRGRDTDGDFGGDAAAGDEARDPLGGNASRYHPPL